jgi:hypothetical protein
VPGVGFGLKAAVPSRRDEIVDHVIADIVQALGGQWFRGLVGVGADLPAHRSAEQLPVSAHQSSCQAAVRGAATHRPDQAASHHRRAVGGASASRNRRFESVPLQQRVCKLSVPRALRLRWRNQIHCTRVREVRIQFPPGVSQQTFGSSFRTTPVVPLFDHMISLPSRLHTRIWRLKRCLISSSKSAS